MIAYDDGVPFALFRKTRCFLGWHKMEIVIKKNRILKYYCEFCKKPRKYPKLNIVDGGNKMGENKHKF